MRAQESAKDLLSESAAVFEALSDARKAAEARVELACCYWREGAFDEARVILRGVLESVGAGQPRPRAMALLRLAIVDSSDSRYGEVLENFVNMRATLRSNGVKLPARRMSGSARGEFLRLYEKGVFGRRPLTRAARPRRA